MPRFPGHDRGPRPHQTVRLSRRRGGPLLFGRAGRSAGPRRPQWRRQDDHVAQPRRDHTAHARHDQRRWARPGPRPRRGQTPSRVHARRAPPVRVPDGRRAPPLHGPPLRGAGGAGAHRGDGRRAPRPPGRVAGRSVPRPPRRVSGAALSLPRRSLANATRRRLARLRQPKYLIGFAVGLLYYYWLIARPRARGAGPGLPENAGEALAILGLTTILVINWLFGSSRSPFAFTPAETHYLFTAPLTRRQVLDFKLLRSQLPLFLRSEEHTSELQ